MPDQRAVRKRGQKGVFAHVESLLHRETQLGEVIARSRRQKKDHARP